MLLSLAASRRLLFVGGKGGVGKTTVASAIALDQSRRNRRVLLVSTDPAHNLGHLWQRSIGPDAVRVAPGLDALELDPNLTVDRHLDEVGAELRRLMPPQLSGEVDKHLALSRDAPGMHEAALLERIAELVEDGLGSYDLLVFDTAPSGHTARLMALPEMMSAWTEGLLRQQARSERFGTALSNLGGDDGVGERAIGGERHRAPGDRDQRIRQLLQRRRHRFEHLSAVLADEARATFLIVLVAERLPVLETVELEAQLRRAGVQVGGLIVNKRAPADQGVFLAERRAQEARHLDDLHAALPDLPMMQLPLLAEDVVGPQAVAAFADRLASVDGD